MAKRHRVRNSQFMKAIRDVPSTSKHVRVKKSDWVWATKENSPIIHQFGANSGVSKLLSNKYKRASPSELSIFLDYMDPDFSIPAFYR
jgi:hypothetical protein